MQKLSRKCVSMLVQAVAAMVLYAAALGSPGAARACDDPPPFRGVVADSEALSEPDYVEAGEVISYRTTYKRTIVYETPDGPRTLISLGSECPRSSGLMRGARVEVVLDHRGQLVSLRVL